MHGFTEIVTSWDHWAFEVVSDLAFTAVGYPIAKWRVRVHDKKVHSRGVQPGSTTVQ